MFNIIDRYIAKEFIKNFLAALVVFTSLFMVVDILSRIWELRTLGADGQSIMQYFLYQIPSTMNNMTPVACLMATILTVSILSRTNELVALFSSGISLARATAPVLAISFVICVCSFFLADQLIPPFTRLGNYVYYVQIKKQPGQFATVKTNKIWYRSRDLIYNIKTLNPEKNLVQGLTIYYFNAQWRLVQMITAAQANYEGKNWTLSKGNVTLFDEDSSFPMTQSFDKKMITLEEHPADIQTSYSDTDMMTASELRRYIKKNKEAGLDTVRYEVAYHKKFSFAFISFVMGFLGIPFSVSRDRSGSFAFNVGICLLLVFGYWTIISIGISLGNHGQMPAILAAWGPNAVMLGVAIHFLLRLKK